MKDLLLEELELRVQDALYELREYKRKKHIQSLEELQLKYQSQGVTVDLEDETGECSTITIFGSDRVKTFYNVGIESLEDQLKDQGLDNLEILHKDGTVDTFDASKHRGCRRSIRL
jgi:hypothetical protein